MEWIPDAIREIRAGFGPTALIIICATAAIVAALYYNRKTGSQTPREAVADAVTPFTCKWSDHDAKALSQALKSIEEVKQNQDRIWRDQDSLRDKVTTIEVQTRNR